MLLERRQPPPLRAAGVLLLLVALVVSSGSGCTTTRYLSTRPVRENALAAHLALLSSSGPRIHQRTERLLKRYGVDEAYARDPAGALAALCEVALVTADAEQVYAIAELAYIEAKKAERRGDSSMALEHLTLALTSSYDYLFSSSLEPTRNPYDPQFRGACDLYNEALEDTLRLLCQGNKLQPGQAYTIRTAHREFTVETVSRGNWQPDEFSHFEFCSDYRVETLNNRHTTYGLGVPLIAVRRSRNDADPRERYYPEGTSYAVTALLRCSADGPGERHAGSSRMVLEFFDPLAVNQIRLANQWVPLETDLTTPLAFFLDNPKFQKRNLPTVGLLKPESQQEARGMFMLEPYDPDRIPVVMVHGLWSSPLTWMHMFNDLRSFPEIRERYQFWFYLYPTGQPFWISATQMRNDLAEVRQRFDPQQTDATLDQMVLVGHSMGGLVSRMQTIDSRDDFWRIISDEPWENLQAEEEDRMKLASTLFFKPNSSIRRVITIGTPHRGSDFANNYTQWLGRKLITLPSFAISTGQRLRRENPDFFKNTDLLTANTAIDSLSPRSPIFPVMLRAPRAEGVKYHNIVGIVEKRSLFGRISATGDGVVSYASAQMDDVESEVVVEADHTTLHHRAHAILEVRRILLEHLDEIDAAIRVAGSSPPTAAAVQPASADEPIGVP